MRIHFLVRSLRQEGAGSHQNALSYIRYLQERGHSVTVHAVNAASFNNPPADIRVIAHAKEKLGLIEGNTFITKLLFTHEKDADIFFLYGVDFIWGAGRYRKSGGATPVAVYLDTCLSTMDTGRALSIAYYVKRLVWEKLFGMRDAAGVDTYIAASPFIKEMYTHSGFPEHRFRIVPNFFEFGAPSAARRGPPAGPVRLLYAGRLTYDKGTDLLITAAKDIPGDIPWHLRIVGDGPLREECEEMIRAYGLAARVEITPWVSQGELPEVYRSADIFIHPSRCPEAFGRTFVEAMSHGIPVIASNIGAAPWTVGNAGVFFRNGSIPALRNAMLTLIRDDELRERLGEKGMAQSLKFTKEVVGPHLEDAVVSTAGAVTGASFPAEAAL